MAQISEEKSAVEKTVKDFFEGFSRSDFESFRKLSDPNIKLIENGQVWNLDTLKKFTLIK